MIIIEFIYMLCMDLRTNGDYFFAEHKQLEFCNLVRECLVQGTNWVLYSYRLNSLAEDDMG